RSALPSPGSPLTSPSQFPMNGRTGHQTSAFESFGCESPANARVAQSRSVEINERGNIVVSLVFIVGAVSGPYWQFQTSKFVSLSEKAFPAFVCTLHTTHRKPQIRAREFCDRSDRAR